MWEEGSNYGAQGDKGGSEIRVEEKGKGGVRPRCVCGVWRDRGEAGDEGCRTGGGEGSREKTWSVTVVTSS